MKASTEERFWFHLNKVEFTEDCWVWVGAKDGEGYGLFSMGKRCARAHRMAYELSYGSIPAGKVIDHICRNKSCVKPTHLRVVTQKQNLENLSGAYVNSKSGIRGVRWHKNSKRWVVRVTHNGVMIDGGSFKDIAEAEQAAIALRNSLYTHNEVDRAGLPEVAA